jgi:hypothetical protein
MSFDKIIEMNKMKIAKIVINDFGGSPVCEHNMPCTVCGIKHAVYDMSNGFALKAFTIRLGDDQRVLRRLIKRKDKSISASDPQLAEYIRLVNKERRERSLS